MRALCLVLLAACELQPPPKQQAAPPAPVPAQQPAPPPAAPPPVIEGSAAGAGSAGAGSGSAAPKIEISAPCLEVGAKIAQVFIDSATDTAHRTVLEQERANMTRKTGEACTTQSWSDQARACYLGTKTPADIKACETKFTPPPGAPPAGATPPAAAGSGVK
jgi:hypothetical protein